MTDLNSNPARGSKSQRKPSRSRRTVVWVVLAALVAGLAYEWRVQTAYNKTLAAIQQKLTGLKTERIPLNLTAANELIQGSPARVTRPARGGGKLLDLTWRGVLQNYPLQLQLGEGDVVLTALTTPLEASSGTPDQVVKKKRPEKGSERHGRGLAKKSPGVLCLQSPKVASGKGEVEPGLLLRELVRQAVLIAARDELGLTTRDSVLRETMPVELKPTRVALDVRVGLNATDTPDPKLSVRIWEMDDREPFEHLAFELDVPPTASVEHVAARMEQMSRQEFVKLLEDAGYNRQPLPPRSEATVPQPVSEKLERLSSLSQLIALRALHSQIRTGGESPALLAGVVEGYAKLGTLCEKHWSPAHKVFKARSLIYAERLVGKYPGRTAFRARAYARALTGLHRSALEDLSAAIAVERKQSPPVSGGNPDRDSVLEAYCNGNEAGLLHLTQTGGEQRLARYLRFLAAESLQYQPVYDPTARNLLELSPDCVRAFLPIPHTTVTEVLAATFNATEHGIADSMYTDLRACGDLPETVKELIGTFPEDLWYEMPQRVKLVQSLLEAGKFDRDLQEPSLQVAAALIQDETFTLFWRLLDFQRYTTFNMGVIELRKHIAPLFKGHPFEAFLDTFEWGPNSYTSIRKLPHEVDQTQMEATEDPIVEFSVKLKAGNPTHLTDRILQHNDSVYRDLVDSIRRGGSEAAKVAAARRLRDVSPFDPITLAVAVEYDWDFAAPRAAEWEKDHPGHIALLNALAYRYTELKRYEDAERCLKLRIKASPVQNSFKQLAALYLTMGDGPNRAKTLEEALTEPAMGGEHAEAHQALAQYYLTVQDLLAATRHADALAVFSLPGDSRLTAADWHVWASQFAADYYQQLEQWDKAEACLRGLAEQYHLSPKDFARQPVDRGWYFWCRRTGRGNLTDARNLMQTRVIPYATSQDPEDRAIAGLYFYAEGELDRALEIFQWLFNFKQDVHYGLQAALMADELGKAELRDSLLEDTLRAALVKEDPLLDLIHAFRNALAPVNPAPLDLKIIDWKISGLPQMEPTNWWYFVGKFLLLRGRQDEAIRYLQRAASSLLWRPYSATMAGASLTRLKITPQTMRLDEHDDEQLLKVVKLLQPAYVHFSKREIPQALELVDQVLERQPDSLGGLYLRGRIAQETEDYAQALKDYGLCLEQLPGAAELHWRRGQCREATAEYAAAIDEYERAAARDARYGFGQVSLGYLLATCADPAFRDGVRALKLAREASELERVPFWQRQNVLAATLAESGDFEAAAKHGLEALKRGPMEEQGVAQARLDLYRKGQPFHQLPRK